jgi:hypothetical protein
VRVFNRSPYDRDEVERVVRWTATTLPLHEDWPVTVALMTTDWLDHHEEGGIAYPDRRGVTIYVPRETTDPWSYLVHVGAHELRHLQQFEERMPGSSTKEPDPDADKSIETLAEKAAREVTGSADIDPEVVRRAVEAAKFRQRDIEADAEDAGLERLRVWRDELAEYERKGIREGRVELPTRWE